MKTLKNCAKEIYNFSYYPCEEENIHYSLWSYAYYNTFKRNKRILFSIADEDADLSFRVTNHKSCNSLSVSSLLTWIDDHESIDGYDNLADIIGNNPRNFIPSLKNMARYKVSKDLYDYENFEYLKV